MSQSQFSLAKGAIDSVDASGRFVFIDAADGPVEVSAVNPAGQAETIELKPREQGRFEQVFKRLQVRNLHTGANAVIIRTAFAQLFTPQDGSAVTIAGQEAPLDVSPVEIDDATPVRVSLADAEISQPVYQIGQAAVASGSVTLGAVAHVFAADADRFRLSIKADSANVDPLWIGSAADGWPLLPGEEKQIETAAAVSVVGTLGEKVHWLSEGGV